MKHNKLFITILFALFGLIACSASDQAMMSPVAEVARVADYDMAGESMVEESRVQMKVSQSDALMSDESQAAPVPAQQERLIIRNGTLSITVEDTEKAISQIGSLAESMNGWVVSSNSFEYGSGVRGSIQARFPAENFNQVMAEIQTLAIEVESVSSSGQDVTDEFVDLGARLKNLEATADRVRAFLLDTDNVEEALAVNVELSRLEGEIEVIKGRMQYLSQSAAYSTVSVEIYPDAVAQPIEIERWLPAEVAEGAVEALAETMQGIANFVIWLIIYIIPVALVIGLPVFFIGRWLRRKWQARKSVTHRPTVVAATAAATTTSSED